MNLVELQQKLAQQHRVSTASLPPMSTFESTPVDGRRLSTVSQPPSMQEYVLQQQIPEKDSLDDLAGKEEGKEDASTSEQVSEETSTEDKPKPRKHRSSSARQQLVVQNVHPDGTVECQLLCKQKTISFKFNRFDTTPADIIDGMVKQELLKTGPHRHLNDHLKDVMEQLKKNPDKVPESPKPYVQKVWREGERFCVARALVEGWFSSGKV
mgnify:FL=1